MAGDDGYDRLDKWGDKQAGSFADRPLATTMKWLVALAVIVSFGAIVFGVVNWVSGWGSEASRVTGAQNTREQTTAVLDDWNGLQAAAQNACDAKSAKSDPNSPTLVESPDLAYRAKYRSIKVDYDRRMNNLFEAAFTRHIPLPDTINNLPKHAPSLKQMQQETC